MSISAGTACTHCSFPVNLNVYTGCGHGCKYCYASKQKDISNIKPLYCEREVKNFISGKRTKRLSAFDWKIPLNVGSNSDPLQPLEAKYRAFLKVLKIFYETGYPFIVTTKGKLVAEEPYITLFEKCSCVVQISMACSGYDKLEQGCPTFNERLEMVRKLADRGIRVVCRIEPFIITYKDEIISRLKDIADAGAYAVKCGGYFAKTYHTGMELYQGGTYKYPPETLARAYSEVREEAHKYGMKFYCQEELLNNRLSDETVCCGTNGLDDSKFRPHTFNALNLFAGRDVHPTAGMKKIGSAELFRDIVQDTAKGNVLKKMTYEQYIRLYVREWGDEYREVEKKLNNIL